MVVRRIGKRPNHHSTFRLMRFHTRAGLVSVNRRQTVFCPARRPSLWPASRHRVRPWFPRSPGPALAHLLLLLTAATALASCETESPPGNPTRETLPNGAVLVRYPTLPAVDSVGPEVTEAQVDLKFGSLEGDDPNLIFGDIRGIQAASRPWKKWVSGALGERGRGASGRP